MGSEADSRMAGGPSALHATPRVPRTDPVCGSIMEHRPEHTSSGTFLGNSTNKLSIE